MVTFANTLALLALMVIPAGIAYWLLIHSLLPIWRRLGAPVTWAIVLPVALATAATPWVWRDTLLADGPRFHPISIVLGLAVYSLNLWFWRVGRRTLDTRTMIGLPEIASSDRPLLQHGIYAHVRHPRYLSAWLFLLSIALLFGHLALWWLFAVGLVGFGLVAMLEEAELRRRYGSEYDAYARRVPAFLPHLGRLRLLDSKAGS